MVLDVQNLHVSFEHAVGRVHAVNGVSFSVRRSEILGIVGESGCGKSVTALATLGLVPLPPGRIDQGSILVSQDGVMVDVTKLPPNGREMRKIRGKEVAMIFQEPMRSLHPMFSIGSQITEGLLEHSKLSKKEAEQKAVQILDQVRLPDPENMAKKYPGQLSGGMRQRAMIAIAIVCSPKLLIADEPTTALDVTIQAQILELLKYLQTETGMSIVLITHSLGIIAEMARKVLVMYLGTVVEYADVKSLFSHPRHPYTCGLLESMPSLISTPKTELKSLSGIVPELSEAPTSCPFSERCDKVMQICREQLPPQIEVDSGHQVRCWLFN